MSNSGTKINQANGQTKGDDVLMDLTNMKDAVDDTGAKFKFKLADNLSTAATTVHDKADSVKEVADSGIDRTKDALESGLGKANDIAHTAVAKANSLGHKTASVMESTSQYVKDFDLREAKDELKAKVVERPELSLITAGFFGLAIGLLVGSRFRKR